jgi:nucleotide-binding universal stress UspA family protein
MTAIEMSRELEEKTVLAPSQKKPSIIVATDGSEAAMAAFNAANLIAARDGADVHVVSVLEPVPVLFPTPDGMLLPPDFDSVRQQSQKKLVEEQVRRFDPQGQWTIGLSVGRPSDTIVRVALERNADLIIVGANKHGIWGRILGEETAMEIARFSTTPLLVASRAMTRLPMRVVVAMDLNKTGLQTAPRALQVMSNARSISCVHVKPRSEFMDIDWAEFDTGYDLAMSERYAKLDAELRQTGMHAELIVLHGDPSHELTDYSNFAKAELLVVGVRRRAGKARAMGGRMAARLIRHAACSVLVVPSVLPAKSSFFERNANTDVIQDAKVWPSALQNFTSRNVGRLVNLEVDDVELGALVEATAYPLLGVDFDHKDGRLTITLGDMHGMGHHLSRTISNPEAVSVLTVNGRDTALSIKHGNSQTLLTL